MFVSDLPDYQQSVSIDAANVSIPVSGSVSITSGSVAITNASIGVINAAGTKITSARPPKSLGFASITAGNTTTTNFPLDTDVQALVVSFMVPLANVVHIKVTYHAATGTVETVPFESYLLNQFTYVFPILPAIRSSSGAIATSLDVTVTAAGGGGVNVEVIELFESAPLWLEYFTPAFAEPNQSPWHNELTLASGVAQWVLTPAANVQINVFEVIMEYLTNGAAGDQWYVAHAAALPGAGVFPTNAQVLATGGDTTGFTANGFAVHPLHGAPLPRGHGIFAECTLAGALNMGVTLNYSLS